MILNTMATTFALSGIDRESALPRPITPLVGRVWEVAEASALLRDPHVRLLTLTGPGGVGKTRLALRIAEQITDDFPHGIIFVPLATIRDPDQVVPAIAERMGVPRPGDVEIRNRLIDFLAGRRMLLLIDNFEQVIDAATEIGSLLTGAQSIKVIVTSRMSLRISGEQEFAVAPLALPRTGRGVTPESVLATDAGSLFVQRARSVRADFTLNNDSATAVASICRRLDGLPLAIELAAARTKILPPAALLERLDHRLTLLADGPRDAPERLRTMRDAIAWSYELLDDQEQRLLRRLSVFAGGFGIEAASRVFGGDGEHDPLPLIASLVDKSLLTQQAATGDDVRFVMLETIRDFGLTELDRHGEVQEAHVALANWLGELVDDARPDLQTRRNLRSWLDRFETEHDNIRTVLDWQLQNDEGNAALDLCGGIFWFWYIRGFLAEGRRWIERALAASPNGDAAARARAYMGAAMMAHWQGDDAQAEPWIRHGIELAEGAGDEWAAAFGWGVLGVVAEDSGRYEDAIAPLEHALEVADRMAFPATVGLVLDHLGVVAWGRGDQAGAIAHWERGLAVHREVGDEWGASIALSYLGIAACERGDLSTALETQRESLRYRWEIRNTEDVAHGLSNLAMIAVAGGNPQRAARLFAAAESTHELIGNPVKEPERSIYQRYIDKARTALGDDLFSETWAAGKMLPLDGAVAEAFAPLEIIRDAESRPFGLTDREMDVLQLMVRGLTDREIADRLFISTRTAQGHASHILGKMGVSSRTAATSLAIREGIATT